ncbi:pantoate--beta-alanine ligase [Bacillus manliponensis]|uniref:pantoate--beta-alanine ligase n=1 Tax=Bacillus manliponensis TaxID=574376 RepID=UPI00351182D6
MQMIRTVQEMQQITIELRSKGQQIGFVPTMGYLHEGHATLLRQARKENDIVILSVFVNPLQFGPNEDFDRYPRDIERDERIAKEAGVDYIFYPSADEMYPKERTTTLEVVKRTDVLCGEKRPGHFAGVATVLLKLFNITMPNRAYFGMKDAQQVAVIEGFVTDYNVPVIIVPVETVREEDGLARSSRNVYLSEKEREEAPYLYKSLCLAKEKIEQGQKSPEQITTFIKEYIEANTNGTVDYVDIYAYPDLTKIEHIEGRIIIAIAVKFEKARLIDNITLTVE